MRIHILGLPHTKTSDEFTTCAFTVKVRNLCKMMTDRGHEVFHYGNEGSDPVCTENVVVASHKDWKALYNKPGTAFYDLETGGKYAPFHAAWAASTKAAIQKRMGRPNEDIICLTWGGTQRTACEGVPQFQIESGIGYRHSWSNYRVYESYAWMHMHMGAADLFSGNKFYWAVIPNAFDLSMFDFNPRMNEREDELLYLGRLNTDKGVALAIDVAKRAGMKIAIVGQGDPAPFLRDSKHVRYLPPVGIEGRRKLLAKARAVLTPTLYVEPFCGVHVEAMLSGTPVITTDWGVFPETVLQGISGFRCRTMEQFVWAVKHGIDKLDPGAIHAWAADNFSLERVALMYEEYFQQVLNVRRTGFFMPNPNRTQLDWLTRDYPTLAPHMRVDTKRPHEPPPIEPETSEWEKAQHFERSWWGLDWNARWDEEIRKQATYARLMDMPDDANYGTKTILDVGCGPVSMLQRSVHGRSRGVDPLAVSDETRKRYADANVEFLNVKAEDMPNDRVFDEVWIYNCLQHVDDPHAILRKVVAMGRAVRIFEWIDLGVCEGHPHNLTEAMFWQHFGGDDYERLVWNTGTLRDFGGTVTNKYIAIHAVCK